MSIPLTASRSSTSSLFVAAIFCLPKSSIGRPLMTSYGLDAAQALFYGLFEHEAAALAARLDQMGARLADLEHPAEDSAPSSPPGHTVAARTTSGPTVDSPADAAWVIDGWRDKGWAERDEGEA